MGLCRLDIAVRDSQHWHCSGVQLAHAHHFLLLDRRGWLDGAKQCRWDHRRPIRCMLSRTRPMHTVSDVAHRILTALDSQWPCLFCLPTLDLV